MKIPRILFGLLAVSTFVNSAQAQSLTTPPANPLIPPTGPPGPTNTSTPITSTIPQTKAVELETPRAIQNQVNDLNLPLIAPFTGTILPTDTLIGNPKPGSFPGLNSIVAGKARKMIEFADKHEFLAKHGWKGKEASDWLKNFPTKDAYVEKIGEENGSQLLPVAWKFSEQVTKGPGSGLILQVNESCRELQIFSSDNQLISDNDSLLSGKVGSVLTQHEDFLTVHAGGVLIDTGSKSKSIACKHAGIKVEKYSNCTFEYLPGNKLLLRANCSESPLCARVKLAALPERIFELKAGQELVLDLKTHDLKIDKSENKSNLLEDFKVLKNNFNGLQGKLVERTRFKLQAAGLLPEITEAVIQQAGKKSRERPIKANSPLMAIASPESALTINSDGAVGLFCGRFFFSSEAEQLVQSNLADLYMKAGSAASVEADAGLLRVQCCSDPKSAILVSDKSGIPLHWGLETLILDHAATWTEAMPADGVGRRAFEVQPLAGNSCVFADFHIGSLLGRAEHLQTVRKPVFLRHLELKNRLLKTAAALQVVTAQHGNYQITKSVAGNPNTEKSKS